MWLTLGGEDVQDGRLELHEVARRAGQGFSTSGPTPGELASALTSADRGQGVVVVTVASRMSGTFLAARMAAELVEPLAARVVDSGTAAGGQGLVVMAAAREAARGADLAAVEEAARAAARRVRLVAALPGLEHLARGGRVPGVAARAGRAVGLHPLFEFRDGRARPLRPARGRRAAHERLLGEFDRDLRRAAELRGGGAAHVVAMHALDQPAAAELLESVRARTTPASAWIGPFSSVMVAHTGPGVVGLAWYWEQGGAHWGPAGEGG